jgi:hypothetical protein
LDQELVRRGYISISSFRDVRVLVKRNVASLLAELIFSSM